MGSGDGWFGASAIIYLVFVRECLMAAYDFIILECTAHFDTRGLEPFEHLYHIVVLTFSPTLLGFPASRVRKYMMLLNKKRWRFMLQAEEFGHMKLFEALFGRRVVLNGWQMCRAPTEKVENYLALMAERRGMPPRRASGRPWSSYQVMSGSLRRMVYAQEQEAASRGFTSLMCNVHQRPSYMSGTVNVPALLRNSLIFNCRLRRLMLPSEHMGDGHADARRGRR